MTNAPSSIELLISQPLFTASFALLGLSIILIWLKRGIAWWTIPYIGSLAVGFYAEFLTSSAVILCGLYWLSCFFSFATMRPRLRAVSRISVIVLTFGMILHLFQGFVPWVLVSNLELGHRALPYTHYLFYDRAIMGVCIVGMGAFELIRKKNDFIVLLRSIWPSILVAIFATGSVAAGASFIDIDFGWTYYFKLWVTTNIFFVVIAEEAIFRSLLQKPLTHIFDKWKIFDLSFGPWFALTITTAFYVLRHIYAGPTVMLFAGVSGLFYGYTYMRTRRIEACIVMHACVDSVHFLCFTYPLLA